MPDEWYAGLFRNADNALITSVFDSEGTYIWEAGFLRDVESHALVVTTDLTDVTIQSGFLRSPAGALVIKSFGSGEEPEKEIEEEAEEDIAWRTGFLRTKDFALVISSTEENPEWYAGFWRDKSGRLIIV